MRHILGMLFWWLIAVRLSCLMASAEVTSYGSLSNGKFYRYNINPSSSYPEKWGNEWTAGVRLVDEVLGSGYPWSNWVGWYNPATPLEVIVDLGQSHPISAIRVHCASQTNNGGIYFPTQTRFFIRQSTNDAWVQWGSTCSGPVDTSGFSPAWVAGNGATAYGAQVKFELTGVTGRWLFVDELDVQGVITNRWAGAPRTGCYHAAYSQESVGGSPYYVPETFEIQAGRMTAANLYYAAIGSTTMTNVGKNYATNLSAAPGILARAYDGWRWQQVGMNPTNGATAADVASGIWDGFFNQFFGDYHNESLRSGCADYIFFRLMNEFNVASSSWYNDPTNFKIAWRRVYNIAQVNAVADRFLWIWSPEAIGLDPAPYYPGDQYVDWVGLSVYPHSWLSGTTNLPAALISQVYSVYSDRKPFMISEGGYSTLVDPVEWLTDWFSCLKTKFPMIKAAFWENHAAQSSGRRIDYSTASVAAYRAACNDPYFIPSPVVWEQDFRNISGRLAGRANWVAVNASSNNPVAWRAGDAADGGLPAAYVEGITTGSSDLYTRLPAEAGHSYALLGELVDFAAGPTNRTSATRVYFESSVDASNTVLRNGWSVELARIYTSPAEWADQISIRDNNDVVLATQTVGRVTNKFKVRFSFERAGAAVKIALGSLTSSTNSAFDPAANTVRLYHSVPGSGNGSGRFGVTGITLSSELARREDFAGINGPLPFGESAKWQAAAPSADIPTNTSIFLTNFPAAITANDTNMAFYDNPMPAGRVAGLSTGKLELFTTIPAQAADRYRITGMLVDYQAEPVDRGMQTRVWIENDISAATGKVNRRGWSFVLRKMYDPLHPANWTIQSEIRSNETVLAASAQGQPSAIPYRLPFVFVRNGSNVTLSMGNGDRVYNATQPYNPANNKLSLYCRPELDGGTTNSNEAGFYDLRILYNGRPRYPNSGSQVRTNYGGETGTLLLTNSSVVARFATPPGLYYGAQRATNCLFTLGLTNWPDLVAPADGLLSITDTFGDLGVPPRSAFYRLYYDP